MQWGLRYYILTFGLILNSFILYVFSLSSGTNSQRDHWGRVGPQQSALVVRREGGGCGRLWRPSVDLRHRRGTDDSRVLLNTSLIPKQWDAVWRLCEQNVIVCWTQLIFNVLPYRLYWFLWIYVHSDVDMFQTSWNSSTEDCSGDNRWWCHDEVWNTTV